MTKTSNLANNLLIFHTKSGNTILLGTSIKLTDIIQHAELTKQLIVFAHEKFIVDVNRDTGGQQIQILFITPSLITISQANKMTTVFQQDEFVEFLSIDSYLERVKLDLLKGEKNTANEAITSIDHFLKNVLTIDMKVGLLWQPISKNQAIDITIIQNGKNFHDKIMSSQKTIYPITIESTFKVSNNFTRHLIDVKFLITFPRSEMQ